MLTIRVTGTFIENAANHITKFELLWWDSLEMWNCVTVFSWDELVSGLIPRWVFWVIDCLCWLCYLFHIELFRICTAESCSLQIDHLHVSGLNALVKLMLPLLGAHFRIIWLLHMWLMVLGSLTQTPAYHMFCIYYPVFSFLINPYSPNNLYSCRGFHWNW